MKPAFTYEGLLSLVICLYVLYSTSYRGYATSTHLLVLIQAVIHNIILSPLFDTKKSTIDRFLQLRENPFQMEHRGGVILCSSVVPLVFSTLYTRDIANDFVLSALLSSVWSSALTVGVMRGARGVLWALLECVLAAYWLMSLTTPLTTPLTTLLITLFVAYWLLSSVSRSVTWGECIILSQIGGTLITWLLPWYNDSVLSFVACVVVDAEPFTERTIAATLGATLSNLLYTHRYPLSLNETALEQVLNMLVRVILRYGLSHVLLSLPVTWLLAHHWPHTRTFYVVSSISFFGHLLLIVRAVFVTPLAVKEMTRVNHSLAHPPSPLLALVALFLYWAMLLSLSLWLVTRVSSSDRDRSRVTRARKWYHVLSLLMFLPPLVLTTSHVLDTSHVLVIHALLLVAYPLVLGLGALVEYLRVHHLVLGDYITAKFAPLLTNIDRAGPIVYSHLALIGGLLGPVTLSHVITHSLQLSLVSPRVTARVLTAGLLVLDVADSAASWFGSKYGHVLWSHVLSTRARLFAALAPQRKSLEGSFAALIALVCVDHVVCALVDHAADHVLVPAILVVFSEALTTQIDNLVLPALYWTLLVATSP